MLVIKNGYVVDPANSIDGLADITIENGKIVKIDECTEEIKNYNGCDVIDAEGCVVAPGLVDVHVHFRDPGFTYKEDIVTGAGAALKGGFTSVVLMANTKPVVDNIDTMTYVIEKGKTTDLNIMTCATVTKGMAGKELTDMEELLKNGAVGFTDDGIPIMDAELVEAAFKKTAKLGVPISLHEESPALIANNGINRGKASIHFGIGGSPREAEISMINRDLDIALKTGAILDVQHISTKEGVELVRQAKLKWAKNNSIDSKNIHEINKAGCTIHAEATPHHFSLTDEAVIKYGTLAKMNPPLREEEDRIAVINGLKDGTIDIIATDHAPHSAEEKAKPLTEAPSGIIGLETALSLGITKLVDTDRLTINELIERMSYAPARMYGLNAGTLSVGAPADIVIFNMEATHVMDEFASKSDNTPFKGWELRGVVKYTLVGGRVVYENRNINEFREYYDKDTVEIM